MCRRLLAANETVFGFHVFSESGPKSELKLLVLRYLTSTHGCLLHCSRPIVGLADDVKLWSDWRFTNSPKLNFKTEEVNLLVGSFVEPIECRAMFLCKSF